MLRRTIPPGQSERETAESILKGNLRVALAALAAGASATAIGLPTIGVPNSAVVTGWAILACVSLVFGGAFLIALRYPPSFLVDRFVRKRSRPDGMGGPIRVWTTRGALTVGALTFGWFLLICLVLANSACESRTPSAGEPSNSAAPVRTEHSNSGDLEWSEPVVVDEGPARRGPWRMNDSKFHYVDDPSIAVTDDDSLAVTWVDNRRQNIFFRRYDRKGRPLLEQAVNISKSPEIFSWLPRIETNGPGGQYVFVLWQEIVFSGGSHGGEIFFSHSTNGGSSFTEPVNLSETKNGAGKGRLTEEVWDNGSLALATAGDNHVYAAWTEYQGPLRFRRSTDGGETFEPAIHVAGDAESPARGPSLAVTPDDTIHLAWTVGEDERADLRLATSTDRGTSFESPRRPFKTEGHSDAPKLATDDDGRLHLAWGESPSGVFERYHIRYARSDSDADGFDASTAISNASNSRVDSANFPSLDVDGDGNLYLLWERYPSHGDHPRGLGFVLSRNAGRSFEKPSVVPATDVPELGFNGSLQGQLMQKLDVATDGFIGVVNSRFSRGETSRIRLFRGRPSKR